MSAPTLDRTLPAIRTSPNVETDNEDFRVDVVRGDRTDVVLVHGELDIATAPLLRSALDTVYARRPRRVEVDLSAVLFLDAQAVTTLVAARRRLASRGAMLALRAPSPIARRVLTLTGFDRVFEIVPPGTGADRLAS